MKIKIDRRTGFTLAGVIIFLVGIVIGMRQADLAAMDIVDENKKLWVFTIAQYETLGFSANICRKLTTDECATMIDAHRLAIQNFIVENFPDLDIEKNNEQPNTGIEVVAYRTSSR